MSRTRPDFLKKGWFAILEKAIVEVGKYSCHTANSNKVSWQTTEGVRGVSCKQGCGAYHSQRFMTAVVQCVHGAFNSLVKLKSSVRILTSECAFCFSRLHISIAWGEKIIETKVDTFYNVKIKNNNNNKKASRFAFPCHKDGVTVTIWTEK